MLRNSIVIQRLTKTSDGIGGAASTWSTAYTLNAKAKDLSGNEIYTADRIETIATFEFIIRYISDITTKDRVSYNNRLFNIVRVENIDESSQWMRLIGEQGVEE